MAQAEAMTHAWKEWGLQALVLLSFTLQVILLILAEFRRRSDSGILKFFVWSAYLLADATAIYVLGHMSVTTNRSPEHELMAFWAPFLLLHLGGQDNITAYAIEDNKLWLRHVQTLAVQVAASAYVLYESPIIGGSQASLLRPASILMFVVGFTKYGERVWALCCADITPPISNYRPDHFAFRGGASYRPSSSAQRLDMEALLMIAHLLMGIPMSLFRTAPFIGVNYSRTSSLLGEELWNVVEMQVSLMHDIFYTKAEIVHTWYGLCIRIISLLATAVAFSLVQIVFSESARNKKSYNSVDVAITYILLVGALILELVSLLRAIFSSRTRIILLQSSANDQGEEQRNVWNFLGRIVASVRRLVHAAEWRMFWLCSMGQHNLFRLCARSRASRVSKIARWVRVEDRWNMLVSSWSTPISVPIKQLLMKQMLKTPDPLLFGRSSGQRALDSRGLYEELAWSVDGDGKLGLVKTILTWHIATNIYQCWYKEEQAKADDAQLLSLAKAIEAISNYMLFLLASRSSMVSRSRDQYVNMCYCLTGLKYSSAEDLMILLRRHWDACNSSGSHYYNESTFINFAPDRRDSIQKNEQLWNGVRLGNGLIGKEQLLGSNTGGMLELLAEVWAELLFCVASEFDSDLHAKELSHGGELTTIVAFLVLYYTGGMVNERFSRSI